MPPTTSRPRRSRGALLPAIVVGLVVLGLLISLLPAPASAAAKGERAAGTPRFVPGRVIVGLRSWAGAAARTDVLAAAGATSAISLDGAAERTFLLRIPRGRSVAATIARLERLPGVRFAEPDWKVRTQEVSNDPYVTNGSLWGVYGGGTTPANAYGSGAVASWASGAIGSRSVVVGIIDEGMDVSHPDLAANIWTNPHETAGDGIDNDGNGYIDDMHGWDFFYNDASVYDAGEDSHGTHVAGTIGGVGGNGIGVAGVNWRVTMISTKFLGPGGGSTSGAVLALNYLRDLKTRHGINIVASNNSWGGGGSSQALLDAIRAAGDAGILFIAAAGNSTSNNDAVGSYPSNYDCSRTLAGAARGYDCVIAVASTTSTGGISSFSSYGATSVDLGAPGSGIWSSLPGNTYGSYSGTSMATPHVTGAAALCAATAPGISPGEIRTAVVTGAQPLASLAGKTVTGGRLDVPSTLAICVPPTDPVTGAPSGLSATAISASRIDLSWTDGATYETSYEVERAPDTGTCGAWARVGVVGANSTSWSSVTPQGGSFCFRVRAANGYNGGSTSSWSNVARAATLPPPAPYTCSAATYEWLDASSGTLHGLSDDSSTSVTLPFTFRFYGEPTTTISVGSNGLVGFSASDVTAYVNTAIPNGADPNGYAAPFWEDLNPGVGGQVRTRTVGSAPSRRFVIAWLNVPVFGQSTTDGITTQVVLEEGTDGIVLQWQDVTVGNAAYNGGASATIGVESPDGTWGTQVSHNTASRTAGSAVRCANSSETLPAITTTDLPGASVGKPYSASLTASGGTAPRTWDITSGTLPDGLSLASDGTISGTPTTAGSSEVRFRVTDAQNATDAKTLTIAVTAAVAVTTTTLPDGPAGVAYSATLAATGGSGTYAWAVTEGSLPDGLSLAEDGTISGTPTGSGASAFTVTVSDDASPARTASAALSITILAAPAITTTELPEAVVGTAYSATLAASGGSTPYTFSVRDGTLPDGLSLAADGTLSGTPTASGAPEIGWGVSGADGATSRTALTLSVVDPLTITTTSLNRAVVGRDYTAALEAMGGSAPHTWEVVSGLPAGLTLGTDGTFGGQATTAGTGDLVVKVTDAANRTDRKTLSLAVVTAPQVDTASLPGATKGTAYSASLAATSGTTPYTWALVDGEGSLPAGLALASDGTISGTPTGNGGQSTFSVRVTDANDVRSSRQLSITVTVPFSITTGTVPEGTIRTTYTYTPTVAGGTTPIAWSVSAGTLPPGLTLTASSGRISGTPTAAGAWPITLRAQDATTASDTKAITLRIKPGAFTLRSPSNGSRTSSSSILLDWNDSRGASAYRWCMDTTAGSTCDTSWTVIVGTPTAIPVSQVTVTGLVSGRTYYWTVHAIAGDPAAQVPVVQQTSSGWRSFSRR